MDAQTILALAIIGGLLFIGALSIVVLLIRRTVSATIAGFYWIRRVFLEHYVWVEESSYYGFPDGSRNQAQSLESYQSYDYVRTDTKSTIINGQTSTTSQPIYEFVTHWRTKYTYEIQEWVDSRNLKAEGTDRRNVHWPAYTLNRSTQEHVKDTHEQYLVYLRNAKGKQYKRKLTKADWDALDEQEIYSLKVNLFGRVKSIASEPRKLLEPPEQTI